MLVAIVDFQTTADNRAAALALLLDHAQAVRAMPGCRTFRPVADPVDDMLVTVIHEWAAESGFAGYLSSDSFAQLGAALRPMMVAPPSSRRYNAALIEDAA
ncbi:hypothetical protein ACMU_15250 [Actibacterium mucosum KCTC 23349]|uniref:ABM domain-containing protein n=1 Tax=Actibacterium mucosum KCTC 23349 TaxID=1454373 RepID=A0A037ZF54_9RHOB|nr:antibiotic biosynthesis monooxygenase [Actibacterium mucosum]KAJ55110.1 hypothetical protein ACMU_15250 [Actibacterium mucosum KCTC 23349]